METREFKESIGVDEMKIFRNTETQCIFCKPKLLQMKTITMEKLEQMQREADRMMRIADEADEEQNNVKTSEDQKASTAEVWSADD